MTREEAIEVIKQDIPCEYDTDLIEALNIAINALEHPERNVVAVVPCGDTISRQAVLDMATTIQTDDFSGNEIIEVVEVDDVKALPPVTPERPKGEWKYTDEVHEIARCSKCNFLIDASGCIDPEEYISIYKYCPNCGADMRGAIE